MFLISFFSFLVLFLLSKNNRIFCSIISAVARHLVRVPLAIAIIAFRRIHWKRWIKIVRRNRATPAAKSFISSSIIGRPPWYEAINTSPVSLFLSTPCCVVVFLALFLFVSPYCLNDDAVSCLWPQSISRVRIDWPKMALPDSYVEHVAVQHAAWNVHSASVRWKLWHEPASLIAASDARSQGMTYQIRYESIFYYSSSLYIYI